MNFFVKYFFPVYELPEPLDRRGVLVEATVILRWTLQLVEVKLLTEYFFYNCLYMNLFSNSSFEIDDKILIIVCSSVL